MSRINDKNKYPIKIKPVASDYIVGSDSQNFGNTVNFEVAALVSEIRGIGEPNRIVSGTPIWIPDTLSFEIPEITYFLSGQLYASTPTVLTLDDGGTLPRIDIIAVTTQGTAVIVKGTESAIPSKPQLPSSTDFLELTFVEIAAGGTQPTGASSELIWDENAGEPTEYTATEDTSNTDIVIGYKPDSGANTGNKVIKVTRTFSSPLVDTMSFTNDTLVDFDPTDYIQLAIATHSILDNTVSFAIVLYNGATRVTDKLSINHSIFGFNVTLLDEFQHLVIPLVKFTNTDTQFDTIKIEVRGTFASDVYLDSITRVSGIPLDIPFEGVPINTSQLVNDGDGTSPFVTENELTMDLSTKADLVAGKVPANQLPSYVDDVIEGYYVDSTHFYQDSGHTLLIFGETGKIYVSLDTELTYRWSGSVYIEIKDTSAVWGGITGTITNQTDLISYLGSNYYPLSSNPSNYLTLGTLPVATQLISGIVSTTNQVFGGNKTIVGLSTSTGNVLELQDSLGTPLISFGNNKSTVLPKNSILILDRGSSTNPTDSPRIRFQGNSIVTGDMYADGDSVFLTKGFRANGLITFTGNNGVLRFTDGSVAQTNNARVLFCPSEIATDSGGYSNINFGTTQVTDVGAVASGFPNTFTTPFLVTIPADSTTASTQTGKIGSYFSQTFNARKNNELMIGQFIKPTYVDNGFTGITKIASFVDVTQGFGYYQKGNVDNYFDGNIIVNGLLKDNFGNKYENTINKQNSLTADGTGVKYPTVDAINSNLLFRYADTGAIDYAGISVASTTQVNIGAVKGYIIDNETNPLSPTYTYVNYAGQTNVTVPTLGSGVATYILLDKGTITGGVGAGSLIFQNTLPTSAQRKTYIYLSKVGHPTGTINTAGNEPDFITSPLAQYRDLAQSLNYINNGVFPFANGVNLNFNTTAGSVYGDGINFVSSKTDPNYINVASSTIVSFLYRTQTGAGGTATTLIDPTRYDSAGTITINPSGGGSATNQYIYLVPNLGYIIQYGQTIYTNLTNAIAGIGKESIMVYSSLVNNSILIGVLSVTKNCTDLTDTTRAQFFKTDKFGQTAGATSGVSTATSQIAYNNTSAGIVNILTDTSHGGFGIQRGSASDSDNTLKVLNGAGTIKWSVTGNGDVTANSTNIQSGTASTIASFDASKNIVSLPTATYPSLTELSYLKGVTSAAQTQLDSKVNKSRTVFQGYTSVTGVATQVVLCSLKIPANTYSSTDAFEIVISAFKSTTAAAVFYKIFHDTSVNGTTNTISSGVNIATTNMNCSLQRILTIDGTTLRNSTSSSSAALTPFASGSTLATTTTFDTTVDNWITITANPSVTSETVGLYVASIRPLK